MLTKTLWDMEKGERGVVHGFGDDLEDTFSLRLMELGFHPGERVTCVQAPKLGAPRLYRVHNSVYSLDDQVAKLVLAIA